jgi:ABC-type branched-subunit amino acid transport system substrate-binding protein
MDSAIDFIAVYSALTDLTTAHLTSVTKGAPYRGRALVNPAVGILVFAVLNCGLAGRVQAAEPTTRRVIELGMSTALTGPTANLGQDMRLGVLAGLERANRAGGTNGRLLQLIALDDGYEPARAAPNIHQLIQTDNVLCIIGDVGTPTAVVAVPIVMEERTPFFAAFTGAGILRKDPPDRYILNYRASYAEETAAMIDALIDGAGVRTNEIAFFTQRDAYGDAGFAGGLAALKRHGLSDEKGVLHVRYERNTLAVENALATLLYAEPEPRAVVMVGAYAPCAKFIKMAHEAGLKAVFLNVSFVGSDALATALGELPAHVIVTQVVPHPQTVGLPIVRDYQADVKAVMPTAKPGFGSLEGYIAARILTTALNSIPGEPTREKLVDALESMDEFDPGVGEKLHYGPTNHQACHHVWPTILKDGAFVPFEWKDMTPLLKDAQAP